MEKIAYTIAETVAASGLGKTSVYGLINNGTLKHVKLGRRTLITAASLHSLLENGHGGPIPTGGKLP